MSKYLQVIGSLKGEDGKSAYQYAQDGGYTGTEAEFAEKLAAEGDAYTLPIASSTQLGGVQPVAKTGAMTQSVGVDAAGGLWTAPGGGGGESVGSELFSIETTEEVSKISATVSASKRVFLQLYVPVCTTNGTLGVDLNNVGLNNSTGNKPSTSNESNYLYSAEKIADEGPWRVLFVAYKGSNSPWNAFSYSAPLNIGAKVTKFSVSMWQANFPVGTKVTVWGV